MFVIFTPNHGEMIQFDQHIFSIGVGSTTNSLSPGSHSGGHYGCYRFFKCGHVGGVGSFFSKKDWIGTYELKVQCTTVKHR